MFLQTLDGVVFNEEELMLLVDAEVHFILSQHMSTLWSFLILVLEGSTSSMFTRSAVVVLTCRYKFSFRKRKCDTMKNSSSKNTKLSRSLWCL